MDLVDQRQSSGTGGLKEDSDVPIGAKRVRRVRAMESRFRLLSALFSGHGRDGSALASGSEHTPDQHSEPPEINDTEKATTFALWFLRRSRKTHL